MTQQPVTQPTGSAISRILRAEGWTPRADRGEGIKVSGGRRYAGGYRTPVMVSCNWDDAERSADQSRQAEEVLAARGYAITRFYPHLFQVDRPDDL